MWDYFTGDLFAVVGFFFSVVGLLFSAIGFFFSVVYFFVGILFSLFFFTILGKINFLPLNRMVFQKVLVLPIKELALYLVLIDSSI